jgi:hypothetical protein
VNRTTVAVTLQCLNSVMLLVLLSRAFTDIPIRKRGVDWPFRCTLRAPLTLVGRSVKCKIGGAVSITFKLLLEKQVWCRLDSGGLGWHRIVPFATCFLEAPCGGLCPTADG